MSKPSVKKKALKLKQNAMQRSETIARNARLRKRTPGEEDEFDYFLRTGELFPANPVPYVHLVKPPKGSDEGPTVVCTCGYFSYGPSTNLLELGREGKKHADESGHPLRSHDA